mmetsp:Transcript_15946/g.19846  ORF Transcript_15946/g.19846 Transcript_15946/m.19846 type:complete len:491 (-) Transcript_15946:42-1514(-)
MPKPPANDENVADIEILNKDAALSAIPVEWPHSLASAVAAKVESGDETIVVLDDDPTGTQTVYDLPVLTEWSSEIINAEFARGTPAFYVMTNSRALPPPSAASLNETVARRLVAAAKAHKRQLSLISRSDSCLRGHYPLEIDVLARTLREEGEGDIDGHVLIPFFEEGGRLTLNDEHYVAEGERLVPASLTPFAKDRAFGFASSNLREYVEEKTEGRILRGDVASVSLEDVRVGGPERVAEVLLQLSRGMACVVNAVSYRDVEVFAMGMMMAESGGGKRFLVRSAASFVRARLGLPKKDVLEAREINNDCGTEPRRGGLVVVGSYVPKTTAQLGELLTIEGIEALELDVAVLLDSKMREPALRSTMERIETALSSGKTVVVSTSRTLVTGSSAVESLVIGNAVSEGLVSIVSRLTLAPRFIIAKGGITSSDVATKGLGIRRAMVLGQAAPGVPVWSIGQEGKFPGMAYVVFPGNVGTVDTLKQLVKRLMV